MTDSIPNGLVQLESLPGRRRVPAPQNRKRPVTVPPPVTPEVSIPATTIGAVPPPEAKSETDPLVVEPAPAVPVAASAASRAGPDRPLRATQVYLDGPADELLRRCSAAGLLQGSRDVTNSGVIRYALARLATQMTPEQVAEAMLNGDQALRRPGRRRI